MNRDPLIKVYKEPMLVLFSEDSDTIIRIIKTSWNNMYSVIYEDAYQSEYCKHRFMHSTEILDEYKVDVERYF